MSTHACARNIAEYLPGIISLTSNTNPMSTSIIPILQTSLKVLTMKSVQRAPRLPVFSPEIQSRQLKAYRTFLLRYVISLQYFKFKTATIKIPIGKYSNTCLREPKNESLHVKEIQQSNHNCIRVM